MPSLGPLRTGEIPGIRGDELRRPVATIALVAIGCLWWLATIPLQDEGVQLVLDPLGEWWQVLTAPFVHVSGWYQFAALGAVGVFGWLLERKHGWLPSCSWSGSRRLRRRWRSSRRSRATARSPIGAVGRRARRCCAPGRCRSCSSAAATAATATTTTPTCSAPACIFVLLGAHAASRATRSARSRRRRGIVLGSLVRARCSSRVSATLIAPGSPSTSRPIDRARHRAARSSGTAASSPPEVIASHTQPAARRATRRRPRREASPRRRGCASCRRRSRARRARAAAATPSIAGTALGVDLGGARRDASASSCRWPSRPKPVTSVSACAPRRARRGRGVAVERRHHLDRRGDQRRRDASPRLAAVLIAPAPSGLVSTSTSPGRPPAFVRTSSGWTVPGHREAVLRLGVVDRVAADDRRARRGDRVVAAAQDLAEHLGAELLERERDEVQRADRLAAHRVDVATARSSRRCGRSRTGRRRSA